MVTWAPKIGNVALQLCAFACSLHSEDEERQNLWPVTLSIPVWQQVRTTRSWGEAETLRCTVCLCSQVTKVKQHLTGAQHGVFMDTDVTWVSLKNGVSEGFLSGVRIIKWKERESLDCWCAWLRLCSSTPHSSGAVMIKTVYCCYSAGSNCSEAQIEGDD